MAETIVQRDSEIEQMTNERNGEGLKHGLCVCVPTSSKSNFYISHHLKETQKTWLGTGWLLNTLTVPMEKLKEHLLTLWFYFRFC